MAKRGRPRQEDIEARAKVTSAGERLDPLDYMLRVIADPLATLARRDRLALAALPYCHAKPGEAKVPKRANKPTTMQRYVTKKDLQARAADEAVAGAAGNGWGDDLRIED